MKQITVWFGGHRYRITYGDDGRVIAVEQEIIPLRHAIHWRRVHPTSRAWKHAVARAARDAEKN